MNLDLCHLPIENLYVRTRNLTLSGYLNVELDETFHICGGNDS